MKRRLLSFVLLMLAFVGVASAQITDLSSLSNSKSYYISSVWYASFAAKSSSTALTCQYARWWNWEIDDYSANDDNCKIAILDVDDDYYLYAIAADKFVNPDLSLTYYPPVYTSSNKLSINASGDSYGPWYLAFGTSVIEGGTGGADLNGSSSSYASVCTITEADDFDATDVLTRFETVQHSVTFNVMYNGTVVDSETFTNVPGTAVAFDKSYAFTTITGTTSATIADDEDQTIELTATVTGYSTEDDPVYYYIKSGDGSTYLQDAGDGNALAWQSSKLNTKPYKFAIIGTPFSGTVYLKSKAGNYAYSATPDDEYGSDAKVYSSSSNYTSYTITGPGTSGVTGGFGLRTTGSSYGEYIFAGNRIAANLSYSSYWNAGETPSVSNQVLQIEEAETEDLTTCTWTVSITAPEGSSATSIRIGTKNYSDGDSFEGSTDLAASSVQTVSVDGYTANVKVDMAAGSISVVYIKDASAFTPSIPDGKLIKVGDQAATMTPATAAEDNDHWYLVCQKRTQSGSEAITPVYDNGSSTLCRAGSDATPETFTGAAAADNLKYLVRFEEALDGAYRVQFATGNFIQTTLVTGDYTSAGTYKFYNINGTDSHFGWNLTTDYTSYGSIVDNNGAGYTLAFWDTGAVSSTGGNNDWYIYPVTLVDPTTASLKVSDAQYATFCAPFDVTIPDGVTATKVTGVEADGLTLATEAVTTTIPANTPVVLYSETTVDETVSGLAVDGTPTAGLLTGVYTATPAPAGSYVLQNGANGVGFYQVGATVPTVDANRCYLTTDSGVKALFFGTATAIQGVEAQSAQNAAIYNLAGQRVNKAQKGIYIINGKKVLK